MIRGAIFDMDGTLLDSMCVWEQLSQRYLDKFGVRLTATDYAALEACTQFQAAEYFMDGTLLDSMCVWEQLSQRYLDKFGVRLTATDYAALEACTQFQAAEYFCTRYPAITESPAQVMQGMDLDKFGVRLTATDYAALEACTQFQAAEYFCTRYPAITESPAQVMQGMDELICARYEALAKPRDGARELLRALRDAGVSMAVATLTDRKHAEKALADRGMRDFFDVFLTIDDVGVSKRNPKIYQLAAEHMELPPAECMVFEDAPYAGETAKRAGCGRLHGCCNPDRPQARRKGACRPRHA